MKKIIAAAVSALIVLLLFSCGGAEEETLSENPVPDVVKTEETSFVFKGVALTLPPRFVTEHTATGEVAFDAYDPNNGDNINFSSGEAASADSFTREGIEKSFLALSDGFFGLDSYERRNVNGTDILEYSYRLKTESGEIVQRQLLVFLPSDTVVITFTDVSGKNTEAIAVSTKSVSPAVAAAAAPGSASE